MAEAAEQSAQDLNSGTKPVDPRHAIDEAKLAIWLEANVEGYAGPLEVRQFKGGQSNPTYQLVTPAKKYVLRRKPPGKLLPSAHAVDREYKVISGLNKADFPVAKNLYDAMKRHTRNDIGHRLVRYDFATGLLAYDDGKTESYLAFLGDYLQAVRLTHYLQDVFELLWHARKSLLPSS